MGMIDLHSHVVPGVDDGAETMDESLAILRLAVEDGITHIAATPHVRADYPTQAETMERGVAELSRAARDGSRGRRTARALADGGRPGRARLRLAGAGAPAAAAASALRAAMTLHRVEPW